MRKLGATLWLATLSILILAGARVSECSQATGTAGTIQGVVVDPSGAPIPSAEVTLSNGITGYNQVLKSGADGTFRLANIPPNTYHLRVQSSGMQTFEQTIDVRTQVPLQIKAQMALAGSTQTVDVSASIESVENVPTPHTDVSQNLLADLPISSAGQGLSDAITLSSGGVVADSNGFFHPQGDHGETTYVVDGQSISDQQNKIFGTQLPPNAFQSLELITSSPNAEYGDKTGLVVNAQTRSGLGQKPSASLETYYGSFGTLGEDATFGIGGANWGNFLVVDSSRTGRFLDTPEFAPNHDIGNTETIFDRVDYQPNARDSFHLNMSGSRNWFQVPNTYDQPNQDQRQEATTLNFGLGYQHTFNAQTLLSVSPFIRQDHVQYFPSSDPFDDGPATVNESRHLTNWGTRVDLSYANGHNNVKVGTQVMQTRLNENFGLGITDATLNPVCLASGSSPVTAANVTSASACAALGYTANPDFAPGLLPLDLSRGGSLFHFTGSANINQQAIYLQDTITIKNLTLTPGLRFDNYSGLTSDHMFEPRAGISYLVKQTNTVLRVSYDRTMETPYNENLVLSSATGVGGLASTSFGGFGSQPLRPGTRDQFDVGFQQAAGKYVQVSGDYFWKYTHNAFDFDTLFNSPLTFPIEWRKSKIDGVSARVSTKTMRGFQAYMTLGHTRARFFGPENGGLIFNSPIQAQVFRIDHDQSFQQTTYLRYQYRKDGPWVAFTWRFDSGEVAGSVTDLADALALDAEQQAAIGFYCGNQVATISRPITSCSTAYGASRIKIPAAGTYNPDHNPPRVSPRNLFDASAGIDNLFHKEKLKTTLKFTAVNITNEAALYNFLSTFSGTHWVSPRSYQVALGWVY